MSKYQQLFDEMLDQNRDIFEKFGKAHKNYTENPEIYQNEFDETGRDIQDIIRRYENRLCSKSESGGYGKYSTNLSEKFQKLVHERFPKIDFVGSE
jgi:hypothetical protein